MRERLNAKLRQIKATLRRMKHLPIPEQGATCGWCRALNAFYYQPSIPSNTRARGTMNELTSVPATPLQSAAGFMRCGSGSRSVGNYYKCRPKRGLEYILGVRERPPRKVRILVLDEDASFG